MTHTMWSPKLALLLLTIALLHAHTFAEKRSYVVYMGAHAHDAEEEQSLAYVKRVHDSHHQFLASFVGSAVEAKDAIFYSYEHHINGFAAMLEDDQAAEIAKHPNVVSVFLNKARKLHTTHSWEFMVLEKDGKPTNGSIWDSAGLGEDVIIANIDSGVWPESSSFSDEGYGPVPKKWRGTCQNNTKSILGAPCNKKLIGASFYNKGYPDLSFIPLNQRSARDFEGHGSHTLSTAGGNFVEGASLFGMYNGTVKGGSPRARVAAYKVCWPELSPDSGTCFDADILKAIDSAIYDGVDVISMSIGGSPNGYFDDAMSIGSFHAVKYGIVVVSSGGNSGPDFGTVSNLSPWMITVGASTTDRRAVNYLELRDGQRLEGASASGALPEARLYPLVDALQAKASNASDNDALLCKVGSLDPEKVNGKILVCLRGEFDRVGKGYAASQAGAVGFILRNKVEDSDSDIVADAHLIPAIHITYTDGLAVLSYINSTDNPLGYITVPKVEFGAKPAPKMADFSSVGPNTITPEILKPDVTAPGVEILAAYTPLKPASESEFDTRQSLYALLQGTSMSCPHVSGVAGLLRSLAPHWSPSAIKSAIMTTSRVRDNVHGSVQDSLGNKGTPFHYGSGHVRPNRAQDPGLVYDLTAEDYLNFLCALGYNDASIKPFSRDYKCPPSSSNSLLDFNYPSITVPHLSEPVTITRRLKNVGTPGKYRALVHHPTGVVVTVEPKVLEFKRIGEEKSFKLTLKVKSSRGLSVNAFGGLVWTDGFHYVRSPIVVSNNGDALRKYEPTLQNRKLIGASFYIKGYSSISSIDPNQRSARDFDGHGSHTLSTAGGNFVKIGSGMYNGTAKGGSPRARVVAYKACLVLGCSDADILKAIDSAIYDGVDVLSMSIGNGPSRYFTDSISIGMFHAVKLGIVVVCSAENYGHDMGTVSNISPWIITVGASTTDRGFVTYLELKNGLRLKGESISSDKLFLEKRLYPLVNAVAAKASNASDNDALLCKEGSLDPKKVKGKILLCLNGETAAIKKGYAAFLADAAGFILRNNVEDGDDSRVGDGFLLPAIHITYTDGLDVLSYINSTDDPLGYITFPNIEFGVKPAPKMADFSSIGPNTVTPEILEPDITAPGVDILAAYRVEPKVLEFKEMGEEKMFKPRLKVKSSRGFSENAFGDLVWTDGIH